MTWTDVDAPGQWIAINHKSGFIVSYDEGGCYFPSTRGISSDDGENWENTPATWPYGIKSLAVGTSRSIFLGSFAGLYMSTDMGITWSHLGNIVPEEILALPSGGMLVGNNGGGLYLFNDNGDSLGTLNEGFTNLNVHTLAMDSLGYVYAGTESGIFRIAIGTEPTPTAVQHLQPGWNLLSLPIHPINHNKVYNYPGALSSAFEYIGGYQQCEELCVCKGYWLRVRSESDFPLWGDNVYMDSVNVSHGWNMIGSLSEPFLASTITSEPPGIVTSSFWEYDGTQYNTSDTIRSGKGYWVKVNQGGKLILSSSGSGYSMNRIQIVPTGEQPPPPPDDIVLNSNKLIPTQYELGQNYPNPFNPSTNVSFVISHLSFVELTVFDVLGRVVSTLVNEVKQPGEYTVTWDASGMPSGVYFYRLEASSVSDPNKTFTQVKKILLVK
jgi:hypothetical protein